MRERRRMWGAGRTAATLPRMNARLRTLVLTLSTLVTLCALTVGPALATESGSGEGSGKVPLPQNSHDQVGLIILGICGLFAVAAGINALRQLKGTRPQADGRIRWR